MREQKTAKRVDQARKDENAASGTELLFTTCPECKMMHNAAVSETLDIAQFVAQALKTGRDAAKDPRT